MNAKQTRQTWSDSEKKQLCKFANEWAEKHGEKPSWREVKNWWESKHPKKTISQSTISQILKKSSVYLASRNLKQTPSTATHREVPLVENASEEKDEQAHITATSQDMPLAVSTSEGKDEQAHITATAQGVPSVESASEEEDKQVPERKVSLVEAIAIVEELITWNFQRGRTRNPIITDNLMYLQSALFEERLELMKSTKKSK